MKKGLLENMQNGYKDFREKYSQGDNSVMHQLSEEGQEPKTMVVACSDSRVDPALILQCNPGELFMVRNVANVIPPFEADKTHHGTSAALEYGVCYLKVRHLIILGHSQCGGIDALRDSSGLHQDDFISNWISVIDIPDEKKVDNETCGKASIDNSYSNCFTFPWIKSAVDAGELQVHRWYFHINQGKLAVFDQKGALYKSFDQI